jgi:hypothetical protein
VAVEILELLVLLVEMVEVVREAAQRRTMERQVQVAEVVLLEIPLALKVELEAQEL